MSFLVAALAGLLAGGLANWASDVLPAKRRGGIPAKGRNDGGGFFPRSFLHYLTLPWYFFRSGACAHCGEQRPLRAPLLEIAMIVAFAVIACRTGGEPLRTGLLWLYAWFLLTVLVIDLEHRLVLNMMVAPAAVIALLASLLPGGPEPYEAMLGGLAGFGAFFVLAFIGSALVGRGAMGMGDVNLAGVIGLMTGYPVVIVALLAGVLLGGIAAAVLLITRRVGRKTPIAYAPYLALGALSILILVR